MLMDVVADRRMLLATLSILCRSLTAFFVVIVISRILGVTGFAEFTYCLVAASLLALPIDYGLELKLLRDGALNKNRVPELTTSTTLTKLSLVIPTTLVFLLLVEIGALDETLYRSLLAMFSAQVAYSFSRHFLVPYRICSQYHTEFLLTFLTELAVLALCIVGAVVYASSTGAALGFSLGRILGLLIIGIVYLRRFGFRFERTRIVDQLKVGMPFALHTIVAALYLNIDVLIIRQFISTFDLGIYQAGIRSVMAACLLALVVQNLFLPRLAESVGSYELFETLKRKYLLLTVCGGMLVSVLVVIFSESLIRLVFGSEFLSLSEMVPYFALVILMRYIGSVYGILLTIVPRGQTLRAVAAVASLAIVIVGDLMFVPDYGIWGALGVLIGSHLVINAIYVAYWHTSGTRHMTALNRSGTSY